MAVKLQSRPELLRGWLADLARPSVERVQLTPEQLRMLTEDVLGAHQLRAALLELVECKALRARFEPLQAGGERVALVQQYMDRVGPAWDNAFALLGLQPLAHAERRDSDRGR